MQRNGQARSNFVIFSESLADHIIRVSATKPVKKSRQRRQKGSHPTANSEDGVEDMFEFIEVCYCEMLSLGILLSSYQIVHSIRLL